MLMVSCFCYSLTSMLVRLPAEVIVSCLGLTDYTYTVGAPWLQEDMVQLHLLHLHWLGGWLQGPRQKHLRGRAHRLHHLPHNLHRDLQTGPLAQAQISSLAQVMLIKRGPSSRTGTPRASAAGEASGTHRTFPLLRIALIHNIHA